MAQRTTQRISFRVETLETRELLSTVSAPPVSVAAPTAELQYALELTNAVRTNPGAGFNQITANISPSTQQTLDYYGVNLQQEKQSISGMQARQPLAWNTQLAQAAQSHSQDMAVNGYQSHTGSNGSSSNDRMTSAGYTGAIRTAENAYAYGESIDQNLQAFLLDWGVPDHGHLNNMLEPANSGSNSFKEVGIGIVNANRSGFGTVMTQDFGVRANQSAELVGVAFVDKNNDHAYSIGEGQGGVVIQATAQDGTVQAVQTAGPGGYQIPLQPGTYQIRAFQGNNLILNRTIQIKDQNQKLDVVLGESSPVVSPTSPVTQAQLPIATVAPAPAPVVAISRTATVISNMTPAATSTQTPGFSWNTWRTVPMA